MRRTATAANSGLRTAARLLKGSKLLPATETTAAVVAQLHQTDASAPARTASAFQGHATTPRSDVRPAHVVSHIRDAKTGAPTTERRAQAKLTSPRGLPLRIRWVQLWLDRRLASAIAEP